MVETTALIPTIVDLHRRFTTLRGLVRYEKLVELVKLLPTEELSVPIELKECMDELREWNTPECHRCPLIDRVVNGHQNLSVWETIRSTIQQDANIHRIVSDVVFLVRTFIKHHGMLGVKLVLTQLGRKLKRMMSDPSMYSYCDILYCVLEGINQGVEEANLTENRCEQSFTNCLCQKNREDQQKLKDELKQSLEVPVTVSVEELSVTEFPEVTVDVKASVRTQGRKHDEDRSDLPNKRLKL
jgi:hypothetical protein